MFDVTGEMWVFVIVFSADLWMKGATIFEAPNLIWMVKMVEIFGNRKSLIDGDRIEIDEIKYIFGDQNIFAIKFQC